MTAKKGPGSRFVSLDANVLEQFLRECGFSRAVQGNEIVYVRANKYHASVKVKVYTSIRAGQDHARGCGEDAIRVVAAYEGTKAIEPRRGAAPSKSFGIYKAQKILRTGSQEAIIERLHERMREAYQFTSEWLRNHWREVTTP